MMSFDPAASGAEPTRPSGAPGGASIAAAGGSSSMLGQYELLERIGRGGMGQVYKAYHPRLKCHVAVKVLLEHRAGDPQFPVRFCREMEAIGQLDDPHVVRARDAGEAGGVLYLVMDYVRGVALSDLVASQGSLPVAEACELIRQAALGLEAIRRHGLVHRDVKPSNLMVTPHGLVKILDLGLARWREDAGQSEVTPEGGMLGTADYLAPEQAVDARQADIRADIYSLGCTLYRLLTGTAPYSGPSYRSFAEKLRGHREDPFPPLDNLPPALRAVLGRMVAKDPAERYPTPAEVAAALAPLAHGAELPRLLTGVTSAGAGVEETPAAYRDTAPRSPLFGAPVRTRRGRWWPWMALVGVLAALITVFAVPWRNREPADEPMGPQDVEIKKSGESPVEPAAPGGMPRSVDDGPRDRWIDLFRHPPVRGFTQGRYIQGFDAKTRVLTVQADNYALLHAGSVSRPAFTMRVTLVRPREWKAGGVGIYLGYREINPHLHGTNTPGTIGSFQFFEVNEYRDTQGTAKAFLARGKGKIEIDSNGRLGVTRFQSTTPLPPLADSQQLEITIQESRLVQARVGNTELPHPFIQKSNRWYQEADYHGFMGTLNVNSYAAFQNAEIKVISPP